VRQELLWLRHGDSLATQEGESLSLEAGIRRLVKGKKTGQDNCVCSDVQTDCLK
jgi:hypothetical protein